MAHARVVGGMGTILLCCFLGCGDFESSPPLNPNAQPNEPRTEEELDPLKDKEKDKDKEKEKEKDKDKDSGGNSGDSGSDSGDSDSGDSGGGNDDDDGDDDDSGSPGPCQPTAGGPYWLQEGETLTLKVSCATGLRLPGVVFRIEPLPPGATYDPVTATLRWTTRLDQAAVYVLKIRAPAGKPGQVKVGVADNWAHPNNVPVLDVNRYTEEYGLPVVHIQGASRLNPDAHVPILVTYRGHTHGAEGKVRGNSSLSFPKNNYTLKFSEEDPFNEPTLAGGFTNRRSLVLVNTFNDNSYLRARMGFELWSRISPNGIHLKTYSAVVFLDGKYHGLYTVVDHVNKHLMPFHGLNKDGNLYKADSGAANFRLVDALGQPKRNPHVGFVKQDGEPPEGQPGAFDDLDELVRFVATSSAETFRTEGPQRISLRDYEDWWILITLLVAQDSDIKNCFHYHDPAGGPWRYIPWDLDGVFGQSWKTFRLKPNASIDAGKDNEMFRRILMEPTFAGPLKARLRASLSTDFSPVLLHARLDALAREIGPSARRDELRWMAQHRAYPVWSSRTDFTTFEQEVEYIRQWITLRWAFLDTQLATTP
jgi:hypothetical protein